MKKVFTYKLDEGFFGGMNGAGYDPTMFSASYGVQGSQGPGYVYSILPFTDNLQQKPNKPDGRRYIHVGSRVRGVGVNNPDKHFTGMVSRIVKGSDGSIMYLYIKTEKTNRFVTVRADDNLELLIDHPKSSPKIMPIYPSHNLDFTKQI